MLKTMLAAGALLGLIGTAPLLTLSQLPQTFLQSLSRASEKGYFFVGGRYERSAAKTSPSARCSCSTMPRQRSRSPIRL